MKTLRLDPKDRREQLLNFALSIAAKNQRFTFQDVASAAGLTVAAVIYHFPTKAQLQRDVMRAAVKQSIVPIVAHGLLAGDAHARKASPELRAACTEYLSTRASR